MSKQFDELCKDLANGVSRRSVFGRLLAGIGAVAGVLITRKSAKAEPQAQFCLEHCQTLYEGRDFGLCMAFSNQCPEGTCAFLTDLSVNSTTPGQGNDKPGYTCCNPVIVLNSSTCFVTNPG